MFELYRSAMVLSKMMCPAYTFALKMPDWGIGRIIQMARSLNPNDGLTCSQRAWRHKSMSDTAKAHRFAQACIPDEDKSVLAFPDRAAIPTVEER